MATTNLWWIGSALSSAATRFTPHHSKPPPPSANQLPLYWNETLRADSYKAKLDMANLVDKYDLDLKPLNRFGPEELESRHRLLFDLVKIIWK